MADEVSRIRAEVERVTNLVRGFGWEVTTTQKQDGEIVLTIKKRLEEYTSPGPETM